MLTDQQHFTQPKSKPARHLASLQDRRRDLQAQHRDALLARDAAQREHRTLTADIEAREDRALAFGEGDVDTAPHRKRVEQLAGQLAEHDRTATALARAVAALDVEMRTVAQRDYKTLLAEAVAAHTDAADRIDSLLAEIEAQRNLARQAQAAAQALASNAGDTALRIADVPTLERIVANGGLDALLPASDPTVRAAA